LLVVYQLQYHPDYFQHLDNEDVPAKTIINNRVALIKAFLTELSDDDFNKIANFFTEESFPKDVNIFIQQLYKSKHIFQHDPNELALERSGQLSSYMDNYKRVGDKTGGSNPAGEFGGIYAFTYKFIDQVTHAISDKTKKIFFKQDDVQAKNIAEFVASRVMINSLGPDTNFIAPIILAKRPGIFEKDFNALTENGENVYIGSIMYDNFKEAHKLLGFDHRLRLMEFFVRDKIKQAMGKVDENGNLICRFDNFSKISVSALRVGDFDLHTGNIGLQLTDEQLRQFIKIASEHGEGEILSAAIQQELYKIDHAAAYRFLEDEVHPFSNSRHLHGPANHFWDFPREFIINDEYANELLKQSEYDASQDLKKSLDEIGQYYGALPIAQFAQRAGMDVSTALFSEITTLMTEIASHQPADKATVDRLTAIKKDTITNTRTYLQHKDEMRRKSLRRFALEIKTSLAFDSYHNPKEAELKKLIHEHPLYYLKNKFHFRGDKQASTIFRFKGFGAHRKLTKRLQAVILKELPELLATAKVNSSPEIFEHVIANSKWNKDITNDAFKHYDFNNDYKKVLDNFYQTKIKNPDPSLASNIIKEITNESEIKYRTLIIARWIELLKIANAHEDSAAVKTIFTALSSVKYLDRTFSSLTERSLNVLQDIENKIMPAAVVAPTLAKEKHKKMGFGLNFFRDKLEAKQNATQLLKASIEPKKSASPIMEKKIVKDMIHPQTAMESLQASLAVIRAMRKDLEKLNKQQAKTNWFGKGKDKANEFEPIPNKSKDDKHR